VTVARKSGKLRFTEWLDETAAERTATTVPVTAKRPETVATGAAPEMRTTAAEATVPPTTPPLDAKSLVDRFIGQEIQVPAPRATFFTPQQAAKRSLDDSAGLVTETLARIHAKQGNTAKAIEAYNKLALKYPDKSAYFAALAKSLEEQQNK
jgi:predicted Zn-dependent protease